MTKSTHEPDPMDAFFAAARSDTPDLPAGLAERVMADALQMQPATPEMPQAPRAGLLQQLLDTIGGWPALAGLAMASMAGIWIGITPPEILNDPLANLLGTSSEETYSFDPEFGFGFDQMEG